MTALTVWMIVGVSASIYCPTADLNSFLLTIYKSDQCLTCNQTLSAAAVKLFRLSDQIFCQCNLWTVIFLFRSCDIYFTLKGFSHTWIEGLNTEDVAHCSDLEASWGGVIVILYKQNWFDSGSLFCRTGGSGVWGTTRCRRVTPCRSISSGRACHLASTPPTRDLTANLSSSKVRRKNQEHVYKHFPSTQHQCVTALPGNWAFSLTGPDRNTRGRGGNLCTSLFIYSSLSET